MCQNHTVQVLYLHGEINMSGLTSSTLHMTSYNYVCMKALSAPLHDLSGNHRSYLSLCSVFDTADKVSSKCITREDRARQALIRSPHTFIYFLEPFFSPQNLRMGNNSERNWQGAFGHPKGTLASTNAGVLTSTPVSELVPLGRH